MKTDELLECSNKHVLNKALCKIPDIKGLDIKDVEQIEITVNDILYKTYGYKVQMITPWYDNGNFVYYVVSIISHDRKWSGNVYGNNMWECFAKAAIKIYALAKEDEKNQY